MKFTRLVAAALILGSLSGGALMAQSGPGSTPAEFPPASYKGKQYVDSTGCVFIRAGIDGNVSWVPRVTRARQGVCGFKPTFAGQVTEVAAAPELPAETAPEQITIAAAEPAPAPAPRPVRKAAPKKPAVVRQVAKRPAPVVEKVAPAPRVVVENTACPNLSPMGQRYTLQGKHAVRCGPQNAPIVGLVRGDEVVTGTQVASAGAARTAVAAPGPITVSPNRRIVPRHVAVNRVNTTNVTVPKGYKPVWEDGRLNPKRAEQTLAGHNAMTLIWTSTVPRRLINQADGRDVTASVPLVYPYTDFARQQRELGEVTIVKRNGQILKRIKRTANNVLYPGQNRQARVTTVNRAPTYSSRSAPTPLVAKPAARATPKGEVAGKGFVQAGAFSDPAAAQARAQRIQRMGLPVRVGLYTKNGTTTRLVIAGPFASDRAVQGAIARLRGAGYNAFAR